VTDAAGERGYCGNSCQARGRRYRKKLPVKAAPLTAPGIARRREFINKIELRIEAARIIARMIRPVARL
jgi:hypothetical protein